MKAVLLVELATLACLVAAGIYARRAGGRGPASDLPTLAGLPVVILIGAAFAGWRGALAVALVLGGATTVAILRRALRAKRVLRLVAGLSSPDAARALDEIEAEIGRARPLTDEGPEYRAWGESAMALAARALNAGHEDRGLVWLSRVERPGLDRRQRSLHGYLLAASRFRRRDRAGAREALVREPQPHEAFLGAYRALEALLDVLEGKPIDTSRAGSLQLERRQWAAPRAHAAARAGDTDEALAQLLLIRADGNEALRRVVAHDGPASRLAEALLRGGFPYR